MSNLSLTAQLEALLFASPEPLTVAALAKATNVTPAAVRTSLEQLSGQLSDRGIRLGEHAGSHFLTTAPQATAAIEQLLARPAKDDLSAAALETLATIAYRGPLTVRQISDLRGVASDTAIRSLLGRGLVEPAGQSDQPGGAPVYRTSAAFLEHFGLARITDLPLPPDPAEPAGPDAPDTIATTQTPVEAVHAH